MKMPSYDAIFSRSKRTVLFGVSPLNNCVQFSSFFVAVDGNVNKQLHLESVT